MHRTRVKICGVGQVADALAAARAGADAIGLVFHVESKRNVSVQRAQEIIAALPPFVNPVGVFVDLATTRIWDAARSMGLRDLQLNGEQTPEQIASLREYRVIKAVRVDPATFGRELEMWRNAVQRMRLTNLQAIVLETAGTVGGSGSVNNWDLIEEHRKRGDFVGLPPLIAAGGLTPEGVGQVVRRLRPWAVDVSSGVEESLGKKSPEKIAQFIKSVRKADSR